MDNNVNESRKMAIIKYVECLKEILTNHETSHQLISKLKSFKPIKDVYGVEPSMLSAMMVFGLIQNKNLDDLNKLLDNILNKVIPFSKKHYPEYDLDELFILISKMEAYRDNISLACDKQHDLSDFDYDKMSDSEITQIFVDVSKVEQAYQQGQFRLMAIHSDYKNFFNYEQNSIFETILKDPIKKSYVLSFSIGAFCFKISTAAFMSYITVFVERGESYKAFYSPAHGKVEIQKKPFF